MPVVVKGLVTAEDAILACEHGASGVVVSNHGGRQLDGAIASLEALPEVVEAVGDRAEVYLDGGVRRGTDVVMALALGARAVLVGRPAMYGLAWRRREGRRAGARDPPRRDGERARAARLPLARRGDSRHTSSRRSARGRRRAHAERRPRAARGRARGEARARSAAAREARDRRHLARHPRRSRHPPAAHARVPGRGPRRRPHRRRLHDPDRRPVGPVGGAADPRPTRRSTGTPRRTSTRPSRSSSPSRRRFGATASGSRS